MIHRSQFVAVLLIWSSSALTDTTRFCLEGELDLGARYQGTHPLAGETYPTTWCVTTDGNSERALFSGRGKSNPDMDGEFTVAYLEDGMVRIVNRDAPPDIEFRNAAAHEEARATRRLDPRRLVSEFRDHPERFRDIKVDIRDGNLIRVASHSDMNLRGHVPVVWTWDWSVPDKPKAHLAIDGVTIFQGTGHWETLGHTEAAITWQATQGADPVDVPGENWPARINMALEQLDENLFLVTGVRTGFQHMVVRTSAGLVIGDAPAGWVEIHQIPPADLVPGLGISGLSEQLIDFVGDNFRGEKIAAVVLTHFHGDHAGGARAFAAAGAEIYAPEASAPFLESALNRSEMPGDRLARQSGTVKVIPVSDDANNMLANGEVRLVTFNENPHVDAMLGIWAVAQGYVFVSDIHVPRSDAGTPGEHRAVSECWFAREAVAVFPSEVRIINSHSGIATPVSRLEEYLQSDLCRQGPD